MRSPAVRADMVLAKAACVLGSTPWQAGPDLRLERPSQQVQHCVSANGTRVGEAAQEYVEEEGVSVPLKAATLHLGGGFSLKTRTT
jgi:hypothetical protein